MAVNYMTREAKKLFECMSPGLLDQKLVRVPDASDSPYHETFLTTEKSVLVRFTIDKLKLMQNFN